MSAERNEMKEPSIGDGSTRWPRAVHIGAVAACLIAGAAVLMGTRDVGLVGWDTYPIIIASRIESASDFVGTFTEKLMDGRYPDDFYRPLTNLSFALDYALWKLEPFGYQLTNVAFWTGSCLALYFLIYRLTGGASRLGAVFGMVFFLLHPSHVEVIPVPARRPESMCAMFMALSLIWQLSPGSLRMRRPPIVPALWALLAMCSKETGLLLPALSFLAVYLYSPRAGLLARMRHAMVAIVPHLIALAIVIGARLAVLGGLGGHQAISAEKILTQFPAVPSAVARLLVFAHIAPESSTATGILWVTFAIALCAVAVLIPPRRTCSEDVSGRRVGLWAGSVIGAAWFLLVCLMYSTGKLVQPWYLFQPAYATSILIGTTAAWLAKEAADQEKTARYAAMLGLLLAGTLTAAQARFSPVFNHRDDWDRATAAADLFRQELGSQLAASSAGTEIAAPPLPAWIEWADTTRIFGGMVLWDYSVQAWADLEYPSRGARVGWNHQGVPEGWVSDGVIVRLDEVLEGFAQRVPDVRRQ